VEPTLLEAFHNGRLLAFIASSPGQVGHIDGYLLEGDELDFYAKKISHKKKGKQ